MVIVPVGTNARVGLHPDDTTSIPRPSRYYGRRDNQLAQHFRSERRQAERAMGIPAALPMPEMAPLPAPPAPPLTPAAEPLPGRIDKSQLTIAEPKRLRDKKPSEVRRLPALSHLWPAALRSASPALCATASDRNESER